MSLPHSILYYTILNIIINQIKNANKSYFIHLNLKIIKIETENNY